MYQDKEIPIGPAEWQMWLGQPTTQAILQALADERSILVQRLALGETLDWTGADKVVSETAKLVGTIAGLTIILEDMELTLQQQWEEAARRQQAAEEEKEEEEGGY